MRLSATHAKPASVTRIATISPHRDFELADVQVPSPTGHHNVSTARTLLAAHPSPAGLSPADLVSYKLARELVLLLEGATYSPITGSRGIPPPSLIAIQFALEGQQEKMTLDTYVEVQHFLLRGIRRMESKTFHFVLLLCPAPGRVTMFFNETDLEHAMAAMGCIKAYYPELSVAHGSLADFLVAEPVIVSVSIAVATFRRLALEARQLLYSRLKTQMGRVGREAFGAVLLKEAYEVLLKLPLDDP